MFSPSKKLHRTVFLTINQLINCYLPQPYYAHVTLLCSVSAVSDSTSLGSSQSGGGVMTRDVTSQPSQQHPRRRPTSTDQHLLSASPQCNGAGDSPGTEFMLQQLTDQEAATEDEVTAEYVFQLSTTLDFCILNCIA